MNVYTRKIENHGKLYNFSEKVLKTLDVYFIRFFGVCIYYFFSNNSEKYNIMDIYVYIYIYFIFLWKHFEYQTENRLHSENLKKVVNNKWLNFFH